MNEDSDIKALIKKYFSMISDCYYTCMKQNDSEKEFKERFIDELSFAGFTYSECLDIAENYKG